MTPPALQLQDLQHLEECWHARESEIHDHLGAPVGPVRLRAAARTMGLEALPEELTTWFEWHDGVDPQLPAGAYPGPLLLPLAKALDLRTWTLEQAAISHDPPWIEADHIWHPLWLPLTDNLVGGMLAADLTEESTNVLIRHVRHGVTARPPRVVMPSLGALVRAWIHLHDTGGYQLNKLGRWIMSPTAPPAADYDGWG